MESDIDIIFIIIIAVSIVSTLIGLSIAIWKQRDRRIIADVVETRHQKRGSDGWLVLFIVTYKDGHTEEKWVDVADYQYETYHNWKNLNSKSEQEYNFEDDMKITIKLRRVFNLCRPKILLILLAEVLGVVAACYLEGTFSGVIIVPVTIILCISPHSKVLTVEGQTVKYRVHRRRYVGRKRGWNGEYYNEYENVYREVVGKAETVEFRQNIIEKIFNVGHIRFIEDGTTNKRSVYGITNFDKRKQEIERIFKTYYF